MRIMTAHANPKVQEFLTLLQDPEVYSVFQEMVLKVLLDPEGCQLLRRVQNIEKHLGADEDYCIGEDLFQDDKEVVMTIPEQLSLISERINDNAIPILHEKETIVLSANETEVRARLLVEKKLVSVPLVNGKRYMLGPEVQKYLLHEIPEEHRATEKSVRQASIEVMKKALELFPNKVRIGKNSKKRNFIEYKDNFYDKSM
jgi:hypothetical protein